MTTKAKEAPVVGRLSGVFANQNGSEIEVDQDEQGNLAGVFRLGECCANHGEREFTLTGFQCGNAVSFCVAFPERASATAWVGQFNAEGHLVTTWQMSIDSHADANKFWRATWTGADVFRPGHRLTPVVAGDSNIARSHPYYCELI